MTSKPRHVAVEGERRVDVADVQVDVADAQAGADVRRGVLAGDRARAASSKSSGAGPPP